MSDSVGCGDSTCEICYPDGKPKKRGRPSEEQKRKELEHKLKYEQPIRKWKYGGAVSESMMAAIEALEKQQREIADTQAEKYQAAQREAERQKKRDRQEAMLGNSGRYSQNDYLTAVRRGNVSAVPSPNVDGYAVSVLDMTFLVRREEASMRGGTQALEDVVRAKFGAYPNYGVVTVDFNDDTPPKKKRSSVPKPSDIVTHLDKHVMGHPDAKRALSIGAYYHYHRIRSGGIPGKSNICLVGPTGTGKTLILDHLAKFLNVPFVVVDATELTPEGYVGRDPGQFVSELKEVNGQEAEHAIIFIDETDKLAIRGSSNFKTADVQKALLKIVEGKKTGSADSFNGLGAARGQTQMDTSKMLFVIGGAFSGLTYSNGYAAKQITSEHLVQYGLMPEFVGRFPVITSLDALTTDDLRRILTEPENSVVNEFTQIFSEFGVALTFQEAALIEIAIVAERFHTGARALRGVVERVLNPYLYDLPEGELKAVEVTADHVRALVPVVEAPVEEEEVETPQPRLRDKFSRFAGNLIIN